MIAVKSYGVSNKFAEDFPRLGAVSEEHFAVLVA